MAGWLRLVLASTVNSSTLPANFNVASSSRNRVDSIIRTLCCVKQLSSGIRAGWDINEACGSTFQIATTMDDDCRGSSGSNKLFFNDTRSTAGVTIHRSSLRLLFTYSIQRLLQGHFSSLSVRVSISIRNVEVLFA